MTAWLVASLALVVALAVCGWRCVRGGTEDRLVALMLSGEVATLALVALSAGYGRSFYIDTALVAAILPYPSAIVFANFYERWL